MDQLTRSWEAPMGSQNGSEKCGKRVKQLQTLGYNVTLEPRTDAA
jgi:hypothetical protein